MEEKSVNKTNTNLYTFIFAIIMVVIVGSVLAFAATSLQPIQYENMRQEKMQSILATVGIETDRAGAEELYDQYITQEIVLDNQGEVKEGMEAFNVDLAKELDLIPEEQNFPLYIATVENEEYYIIPLRGSGLWNAIFGYVALKGDLNTIAGIVFGHVGETPGLGAEITKGWFMEQFEDEQVFDGSGNFVGVSVVKGGAGDAENAVDGISGATITADGVENMIYDRLTYYLPYFENETELNVANN